MKTFKVTVDGHSYTVEVEELKEQSKNAENNNLQIKDRAPKTNPKTGQKKGGASSQPEIQKKSPVPTGNGKSSVKAPMPGSIIEVKVKEGDKVKDGDVLLILEAMKMENELTAPQSGTVIQVLVKKGDTVNSGDPLIILS